MLLLFLGSVEPDRVGGALRGLRVPEPLVRLFVLTARQIVLFRDEVTRLREAMRARGFVPRTDGHTWRSYGNLVGMLLVRALERARRVEEAMLCRGYDGRFPYLAAPPPAARDWAALALIAAAAGLATGLDRL
jgi:cobalt/nickel transport system permease protein